MSDEFTAADTVFPPDSSVDKSVADRAAETIRSASHRISDAINAGREPDMPLDLPFPTRLSKPSKRRMRQQRVGCRGPMCL
jgi:hypothetical protein